MRSKLQIILSGHSRSEIEAINTLLSNIAGITVDMRLSDDGSIDPLHGVTDLPDVLIVYLNTQADEILKALARRSAAARPVTLVIGTTNTTLMRLAMQAGVRDFYPYPVKEQEIAETLRQIAKEKTAKISGRESRLSAIINAKGGSGASVLACNLAHNMALKTDARIALLDMDLQFGTQALNLNLKPMLGIFEALDRIDSHDIVALNGFFTKHKSGLHLLSTLPSQIGLPGDISVKRLRQLMDLMLTGFDHVVVDLPRLVDPVMNTVLDLADHIVICMQQNVANLRDAQRLISIITKDLDITPDRIIIVINRYQDKTQIQLRDVEKTLHTQAIVCIPNDYKRVSSSLNLGSPLSEIDPGAPITHALSKLAVHLSGIDEHSGVSNNLVGQLFSRLFS